MRGAGPVLGAALALLGCVEPPLVPSPGNPEPAGGISGTVLVTGTEARGDLYVFLLPQPGSPGACPPAGDPLAEPANVVRLPEDEVFSDPGGASHSAAFTVPQVPAGCWSLTALVDADDDFNPLFSATAGATRGDAAGGAFIEPVPAPPDTPVLRVLEVARDGDLVKAVAGVQVLVALTVPLERPSFSFSHVEPPALRLGSGDPLLLELNVRPLSGDWVSTSEPFFPLVLAPDADGDGLPEVSGVRVVLTRLAPAASGRPPWAEDEASPRLLPAAIDARPFGDPPDAPGLFPATSLALVVPPLADDDRQSPAGRYGVLVLVEASRQTWRVPNELLLLDGDASQGAYVEVRP